MQISSEILSRLLWLSDDDKDVIVIVGHRTNPDFNFDVGGGGGGYLDNDSTQEADEDGDFGDGHEVELEG